MISPPIKVLVRPATMQSRGPLGVDMKRREFVTQVGGAAVGVVSTQPLMQC